MLVSLADVPKQLSRKKSRLAKDLRAFVENDEQPSKAVFRLMKQMATFALLEADQIIEQRQQAADKFQKHVETGHRQTETRKKDIDNPEYQREHHGASANPRLSEPGERQRECPCLLA